MDNTIKFIDQRLLQLRALIPQFREHSTDAETRIANEIITWELKRFEAIQALEKKLCDLRKLIPAYKARCTANEYVLADQIINLELQLYAAKSNNLAPHQPAPQQPASQPFAQQPPRSNKMPKISTDRPKHIPNL